MLQYLHLLGHNSLTCMRGFLVLLLRQGSHSTPIDLLDMVRNVLLMQIIFVKLWEHFPDVVDHELWQLSIVILNDETEELSIIVVHDISNLLFERKWRQLFPFELGIVLTDMHHVHFVLYFECFVHFV